MSASRCDPGPAPVPGELRCAREEPSLPECQEPLVAAVIALLRERDWVAAADEVWLRLCLEEAVANAMLHGNQGDPGLSVTLECGRDGDAWVVLVHDRGRGFDPATLPAIDGDDPETLLREHGRGVHLMREWLDDLRWYRGGASVRLSRAIATS